MILGWLTEGRMEWLRPPTQIVAAGRQGKRGRRLVWTSTSITEGQLITLPASALDKLLGNTL